MPTLFNSEQSRRWTRNNGVTIALVGDYPAHVMGSPGPRGGQRTLCGQYIRHRYISRGRIDNWRNREQIGYYQCESCWHLIRESPLP